MYEKEIGSILASEKLIDVESWNYAISVCQFTGATYNYNLFRHRLCKVQRRPPLYKGKDVDQMACLGELVNKYFPWEFKISMQVYVMWLPLILNTALPLALLLTLNSFIYARLATVRQMQRHKYKYFLLFLIFLSLCPPFASTPSPYFLNTLLAKFQSIESTPTSPHQLRSRMRRSQEGTLRRRERRMAR